MMQPRVRKLLAGGFPLAAALLLCGVGQAEERVWDFTPQASVSQTYSDNITLAPRGEEEHEYISQLNAGFTLLREGAMARARLGYNLQGLGYWRDSDRNDVLHRFTGDGRLTLLPERFFIDASATYNQRLLSRDGVVGDNLTVGADRSDVLTMRLSPVFIQRLDDIAVAQLGYTYDRVDYQASRASQNDSESNRVFARLDSGPMFSQLGWGLSFERSETDFDDGSSVTFQVAEALGRWPVTDRVSVFGAVGDERNDFEQDPSRARPDDTFWRVGATFDGGARTFAEAFFGERFFGRTYGGSLRHRLRTAQLSASYTEALTTVNDFELIRVVLPVFDQTTGSPVLVDGEPIFVELELPDLQTGVYLSKRFSAGISGALAKTDWSLRAFDERREFEISDRRERVQGVAGTVSWRMLPRTRLFGTLSFEEQSFSDDSDRDDTLLTSRVGVSRDLGRNMSASVEYLYRERNSDVERRDHRENRVTATLRKAF